MKIGSFILLLLFITMMLSAETFEYSKNIDYPRLKTVNEYLRVEYEDFKYLGTEGEPFLPWCGIDLLLPQNEQLKNISIANVEYYPETQTGTIVPAERQFPICQPAPSDYQVIPDAAIYNRDGVFPESCISDFSTNFLCGYGIGSFCFCPVGYNPVSKTLRFIKTITFSLETEPVEEFAEVSANLRNGKKVEKRLTRIIENPEAVTQYATGETERITDYDLLLITSSDLAAGFQEYIDYKNSTGYSTTLKVTEEIYAEYPGLDAAEQVRNCIIDYYQTYGIEYVVLGGDAGNSNE